MNFILSRVPDKSCRFRVSGFVCVAHEPSPVVHLLHSLRLPFAPLFFIFQTGLQFVDALHCNVQRRSMLGIVKNTTAGTPFLETNTRHTGKR